MRASSNYLPWSVSSGDIISQIVRRVKGPYLPLLVTAVHPPSSGPLSFAKRSCFGEKGADTPLKSFQSMPAPDKVHILAVQADPC